MRMAPKIPSNSESLRVCLCPHLLIWTGPARPRSQAQRDEVRGSWQSGPHVTARIHSSSRHFLLQTTICINLHMLWQAQPLNLRSLSGQEVIIPLLVPTRLFSASPFLPWLPICLQTSEAEERKGNRRRWHKARPRQYSQASAPKPSGAGGMQSSSLLVCFGRQSSL